MLDGCSGSSVLESVKGEFWPYL